MFHIYLFISVFFVPFLAYSSKNFDENGLQTKAHQAAIEQDIGYLKYLIKENVNPLIKDVHGKSAFDYIKNKYDKKALKDLYQQINESKKEKNQENKNYHLDLEKIEEVLKTKNIDIDVQNKKTGQTSMHQAIILENLDFVKLLLKYGASLEVLDYDQKKPTDYASPQMLKEIEKMNLTNKTLSARLEELTFAALKEDEKTVQKILHKNASLVNAKNEQGNTPLHEISVFGNSKAALLLIKNGALLNERNKMSETPLIKAVSSENTILVEALLDHNVQIDWYDINGKTALHHAAELRNKDSMMLLLKNGASALIKDNMNRTAFDYLKANDPQLYSEIKTFQTTDKPSLKQNRLGKINPQKKPRLRKFK